MLKLFVYDDISNVAYSWYIGFAIAESEEEARKLIAEKAGYPVVDSRVFDWSSLKVYPLDSAIAFYAGYDE